MRHFGCSYQVPLQLYCFDIKFARLENTNPILTFFVVRTEKYWPVVICIGPRLRGPMRYDQGTIFFGMDRIKRLVNDLLPTSSYPLGRCEINRAQQLLNRLCGSLRKVPVAWKYLA